MSTNPNVSNISAMLMLGGFSNEDLNKISQAIVFARSQLGKEQMRSLRVGQRVSWNGKRGPQTGTVTKIAIKFVTVQADNLVVWRVPAAMLTAA